MRIASLIAFFIFSTSAYSADDIPTLLKNLTDMADSDKGKSTCPEATASKTECLAKAKTDYAAKCAEAIELARKIDASADDLAKVVVADIGPNSDICKSQLDQAATVDKSVKEVCQKCWKGIEALCDESKTCSPSEYATCGKPLVELKKELKPDVDGSANLYQLGEEHAVAAIGQCEATHKAAKGGDEDKDKDQTPPGDTAGGSPAPQQPAGDTSGQASDPAASQAAAQSMQDMFKKDEEKKDEEEAAKDEEPKTMDCATDEKAYLYAACTSKVLGMCTANPGLTQCRSFQARYCADAAANAAPADAGGSSPYLAKGAGAGGEYCKTSSLKDFCAVPAHSVCPSCTGAGGNTSPDQANSVKWACDGTADGSKGDPCYSSGTYQASTCGVNGGAASTVAAGAGGGGGSMNALSMGVQSVGGVASIEDSNREGLSIGVDSASGGYSQPGGSGIYGDESSKPGKPGKRGIAATGAVATASGLAASVTDVGSNQFGNVFSIGSEVIRIRCLQGKHLHCEPSAK